MTRSRWALVKSMLVGLALGILLAIFVLASPAEACACGPTNWYTPQEIEYRHAGYTKSVIVTIEESDGTTYTYRKNENTSPYYRLIGVSA